MFLLPTILKLIISLRFPPHLSELLSQKINNTDDLKEISDKIDF